MIRGGCLCGGVTFQITHATGPFELCHCSRCRKASGSAFVAGLSVMRQDFELLSGRELIQSFEAPIRLEPPACRTVFCGRCGSPLPDVNSESRWLELPAGLLDDDPQIRPERHIFVEAKSSWFTITDNLPQLDLTALIALRQSQPLA
jgi:hypothetical protein